MKYYSKQARNSSEPLYRAQFRILAGWVASVIDTVDRSSRIYLSTVYITLERARTSSYASARRQFNLEIVVSFFLLISGDVAT